MHEQAIFIHAVQSFRYDHNYLNNENLKMTKTEQRIEPKSTNRHIFENRNRKTHWCKSIPDQDNPRLTSQSCLCSSDRCAKW